MDSGHFRADPGKFEKKYVKIYRFWTLLGRSCENLLFAPKNLILATHPELAKFTLKSIDSEHFWADPGKICFFDPKTKFLPTTQNQTAPAYVLARWRISRRLSGYYINSYKII